MLRGKKIILGITGSIAAYKSALLVRELITAGADVKVIMTDAAKEFITPLTLSTLSKNPVLYRFTDDVDSGEWNNHVELGLWADALVIAPCSANTLAKMSQGICDNLLMATYLSARCPVFIAPAMDLDMYAHDSTQANLNQVIENGVEVIYPESGELASGLHGQGRMSEPDNIRGILEQRFDIGIDLRGKKILITAGPTYEDIDPIRFLGNRSTGRMGYALADQCASCGAEVTLVSGPVHVESKENGISKIEVRSAQEMHNTCMNMQGKHDVIIMAAAVADYKPLEYSNSKIKKKDGDLSIKLTRTEDILKAMGANKKKGQIIVGFALETDDEVNNAKRKLKAKNLDLIVLNSMNSEGAGPGGLTNRITIIGDDNKMKEYELKTKEDVALDILKEISLRLA